MTAVLINASPKRTGSVSGILLEALKIRFPQEVPIEEVSLHKNTVPPEVLEVLARGENWIFACPLYVDGIPSHLLSCLEELEAGARGKTAYAIVNCGFYEGIQAELALRIFASWCAKAGITWGGGLGVGGGGAIASQPPGNGPMSPVNAALKKLAGRVSRRESGADQYCTVAFPRFLYKLAGEMGWRKEIRRNGGRAKDLGRRPKERD